jgi:hypothetical protein
MRHAARPAQIGDAYCEKRRGENGPPSPARARNPRNGEISATETVKAALELRDAQRYEYPQGVDFIFYF